VCRGVAPRNVTAAAGAVGILRRLMQLIRHFLPECVFGFVSMAASPSELLDFLDAERRRVCGGDGQKCGVEAQGQAAMRQAASFRGAAVRPSTLPEANYAAKTWPQERRILIKAEVVQAAGKEPRTIRASSSQPETKPAVDLRKVYCQRARSRTDQGCAGETARSSGESPLH